MNKVEAAREWICSHNDGDVLYVKDAFVSGADWAIDKACEWLKDNLPNWVDSYQEDIIIEEIRKTMEE